MQILLQEKRCSRIKRNCSKSCLNLLHLKSSQSPKGVKEIVKITDLLFASTGVIGEEFPTI